MKGKPVWAWAVLSFVLVSVPLGVLARNTSARAQGSATPVQLGPENHFGVREPADREVIQLTGQVDIAQNSSGPVMYRVPDGKVLVVDHVSFFSTRGFVGPLVLRVLPLPQHGSIVPALFVPAHSPVDLIPEQAGENWRSPAHFRPFRSEADADVQFYVPGGTILIAGVWECPHSCGSEDSQITVVGHLADYIAY